MPTQVRGEDGRILHQQLGDQDAHDLAFRVHEATGETVTLIPFRLSEGLWGLDEEMATAVGGPAVEKPKKAAAKGAA